MNRRGAIFSFLRFFLCSLFFVFQGCQTTGEQNNQGKVIDITVTQAFELIQNNQDNENFVILDVRTPSEYQQAHLEKAINMDYYAESFQNRLEELNKNKIYLVYCQSGNRSAQAVNIMKDMGFAEIYNMLGGISAWISGGYPVISGAGLVKVRIQISKR